MVCGLRFASDQRLVDHLSEKSLSAAIITSFALSHCHRSKCDCWMLMPDVNLPAASGLKVHMVCEFTGRSCKRSVSMACRSGLATRSARAAGGKADRGCVQCPVAVLSAAGFESVAQTSSICRESMKACETVVKFKGFRTFFPVSVSTQGSLFAFGP